MRLPPHLIARVVSSLARLLFLTIRLRIEDHADFIKHPPGHPVIFTFWHNRILAITPCFLRKYPPGRGGVSVLTSPSRDGRMLAKVAANLGMGAVFGSNNKRPAAAIQESLALLEKGGDLAITPDGPRGPIYRLSPGVIYLSQTSEFPILPMHAKFSRCIRLKSWDNFCIPLPFSEIRVRIGPYEYCPATPDETSFEAERQRIETLLKNEAD